MDVVVLNSKTLSPLLNKGGSVVNGVKCVLINRSFKGKNLFVAVFMANAVVPIKPVFAGAIVVLVAGEWLIISNHQFCGHLPLIVQIKGDVMANSKGSNQLIPIAPRTPDVELCVVVTNLKGGLRDAADCLSVCSAGQPEEDVEIFACSIVAFSNSWSGASTLSPPVASPGTTVLTFVLTPAVETVVEFVAFVDLLVTCNNFLGTNSECITNAIAISVDMPSSNSDANEELITGCQFCMKE